MFGKLVIPETEFRGSAGLLPPMSAASELAPVVVIDDDTFDYVIDKGPITNFTISESGALESLCSLRIFGLRHGFTECGDLPGHYMTNTWTGEDPLAVQCLEAPALVHFKDKGLAPAFVLEWKSMNEKLYGLMLSTAVKVGNGSDPDKSDKWLTEKDIYPVKLA